MNVPSRVSHSDMPAAKMIGRHSTAYHGRVPVDAAEPARASRPTSVAVSKPSPNRKPRNATKPTKTNKPTTNTKTKPNPNKKPSKNNNTNKKNTKKKQPRTRLR